MHNNDILRRLRFALKLSDNKVSKLFALSNVTLTPEQSSELMLREDEGEGVGCTDDQMRAFLDGLILDRRGPPKNPPPVVPWGSKPLTNNEVLKKIRIAMTFQEGQMLELLSAGGHPLSKAELTALFRKPGHKHYREAGDQVLRKFLRGLTMKLRPEVTDDDNQAG